MSEFLFRNFSQVRFQAARTILSPYYGHSVRTGAEFLFRMDACELSSDQLVEKTQLVRSRFQDQDLSESMGSKTQNDFEILREIHDLINLQTNPGLCLQSSYNQVAYWQNQDYGYGVRSLISSAHFLPNVPTDHKCHRLHGHNFDLRFYFHGFSMPDELHDLLERLVHSLDRKILNEIPGLENPTSEILCLYLYDFLQKAGYKPARVEVLETESSGCSYEGGDSLQCYKTFDLQSALQRRDQVLGHGYLLRPVIRRKLCEEYGWVMDFAKIKEGMGPLVQSLDHRDLRSCHSKDLSADDELIGLIQKEALLVFPDLCGIFLQKSRSRGCSLFKEGQFAGGYFETTR